MLYNVVDMTKSSGWKGMLDKFRIEIKGKFLTVRIINYQNNYLRGLNFFYLKSLNHGGMSS